MHLLSSSASCLPPWHSMAEATTLLPCLPEHPPPQVRLQLPGQRCSLRHPGWRDHGVWVHRPCCVHDALPPLIVHCLIHHCLMRRRSLGQGGQHTVHLRHTWWVLWHAYLVLWHTWQVLWHAWQVLTQVMLFRLLLLILLVITRCTMHLFWPGAVLCQRSLLWPYSMHNWWLVVRLAQGLSRLPLWK